MRPEVSKRDRGHRTKVLNRGDRFPREGRCCPAAPKTDTSGGEGDHY